MVPIRCWRSLCSNHVVVSSFLRCGLAPELCKRLADQGISIPTPVQQKSLGPVLDGRHVVINAETGSGKTLCYLLPVLQTLHLLCSGSAAHLPTPHSVVLVPTPDLAHQVSDVFNSLADPLYGCSVAHSGSRLSLSHNTQLIVAVPGSLMTYDLQRLLRDVRLFCVDEVDVLLTGGEKKATWQLLNILRDLHQRDVQRLQRGSTIDGQKNVPVRQLLFTAATLPHGGPKTAGSLLAQWVPRHTLYITTDHTHQTVSTSHHTFTCIDHQDDETTPTRLTELKLCQLEKDLIDLHGNQDGCRVVVFTNTLSSAEVVYGHLTEVGVATTPPWWAGHVGQLHGGMKMEERVEMVQQFKEGGLQVLVSTDLVSRGIDLPGVTAIIQFDFPENSAHYLHRAGRTARGGREGKVLSYTTEADRDLAAEIQEILADRSRSFQEIFSRNKMFRRKIKSRKEQQLKRKQNTG